MKINITDKEKVCKIIKDTEGCSKARRIEYSDITDAVAYVEGKLDIPNKHLLGVSVCVDPNAQVFPRSYQYTPMSTYFTIKKFPSGWFVVDMGRHECCRHRYKLSLPEEAKLAILNRFAMFD